LLIVGRWGVKGELKTKQAEVTPAPYPSITHHTTVYSSTAVLPWSYHSKLGD